MKDTLDSQMDATHTLLAETYTDPLVTIARVTLSYSDTVFVRIAHDELPDNQALPEDPSDPYERGVDAIHHTWSTVSNAFEPAKISVEWGHSANQTARTYRFSGDRSALTDLLMLTKHQINGAHFVAELLITSDEQPALYALPHHQYLRVDADVLESDLYLDAVADALSDQSACLATCEEMAWKCEGARYRLSGSSFCIEPSDTQSTCWRLTRLRRIAVHPTRPELVAEWNPATERPILGAVVRGVARLLPFPELPERIPCSDRKTAQQAHDLVAETFQQYDGRAM